MSIEAQEIIFTLLVQAVIWGGIWWGVLKLFGYGIVAV